MSSLAFRRVFLLATGVSLLAGCHTYRTVESPPVGSTVRVRVPVTSALSNPNSAPPTASIEGVLISMSDTITLATQTRREFGAYREITQYDTLRFASSQANSLEIREFARNRSVVLGVAIAAGAGFGGALAFGLGGGSKNQPPDGQGPLPAVVVSGSLLSTLWGAIAR
jgi:hypothetical protein